MRSIKIILLCIFSILLFSCKTTNTVIPPVETITVVNKVDSVVIKDSVVVVPREVVKEIINKLDTLKMETSMARAEAYLDTTNNVLRGSLTNKDVVKIVYKDRDHFIYRDSIEYKEKPVPYPVDRIVYKHTFFDKLCIFITLGFVFYIIIILILKYIKIKLP